MARSFLKTIQRYAYFTSRTAGDVSALQRGVLAKRLIRRSVTRRAFRLFR